jgi:cold shock CspA family protein
MRFKGTLVDWKDDRGFGFIEPAEGGARIFCHLKAFEVRVRRPMSGDKLTYELGKDAQGRLSAVKVRPVGLEEAQYQANIGSRRSSQAVQGASSPASANASRSSAARNGGVSILLVAGIAFAGWSYFQRKQADQLTTDDQQVEPATLIAERQRETAEAEQTPLFQCDGRVYCSDMRSRAEAEFFVKHCPGTKMDGDGDGEPCESDSRF